MSESQSLRDLIEQPRSGFWGASARTTTATVACRVVRNGDVGHDGVIQLDSLPIRWFSPDEVQKAEISGSDAVLVSSGAYTGNVGRIATFGHEPVVISNFVRLLRPVSETDSRYLYHLSRSEVVQKHVWPHTGGSAIPNLGGSFYSSAHLPFVATKLEQGRIAEILDTIDAAIRHTEAIIAKLKAVNKGLLYDLLMRGVDNNGELRPPQDEAPHLYKPSSQGWIPKEWDEVLLDDIALRGSGHTPSKSVPSYWNGGIKWVSLADSHRLDQIFISETDKQISALGIANSSAVLHPAGTVVLSRDAGVGKSAVLAREMAVSQHFMAWQCTDRLSNLFLYFYLQREKPRFEAIALGSTVKTIGLPFFKAYKIVVPQREEQDQAVAILMSAEQGLANHVLELAKLRSQKLALMDDLLTGRVRVTPLLEKAEH